MASRATVASAEDEAEGESLPFADLEPVNYGSSEQTFLECRDWLLLPKAPQIYLQQSRPQPMVVPPIAEKPTPKRVGYGPFAERFAQLERAGIIDGSGQWPEKDVEIEVTVNVPDTRTADS